MRHWFAADFLGIAMVTPLYIFFHQGQRFSLRSRLEAVLLLILLFTITVWCFRYSHTPILWLVLLCLLLCGVRIGFSGAAAALLMVTFIGAYYTIKGFGPLTENTDALPMRILLFQCFVAMCMLALYVTEVARTANRRLQASLAMSETRFRSLAETSRDVLVLAELDGTRSYMSPSAVELTGFDAEELVGQTIFDDVHPEDQIDFRTMFTSLLAGETTSPLAYRILRKDATYHWIEVNARLSAKGDGDEAQNLVFVMRDIADRKEAEEKLLTAFRVAEKLALVDGLTGLANRRLFDETLAREWQRSMRERDGDLADHDRRGCVQVLQRPIWAPGGRRVLAGGGGRGAELDHADDRSAGAVRRRGVCSGAAEYKQRGGGEGGGKGSQGGGTTGDTACRQPAWRGDDQRGDRDADSGV